MGCVLGVAAKRVQAQDTTGGQEGGKLQAVTFLILLFCDKIIIAHSGVVVAVVVGFSMTG